MWNCSLHFCSFFFLPSVLKLWESKILSQHRIRRKIPFDFIEISKLHPLLLSARHVRTDAKFDICFVAKTFVFGGHIQILIMINSWIALQYTICCTSNDDKLILDYLILILRFLNVVLWIWDNLDKLSPITMRLRLQVRKSN